MKKLSRYMLKNIENNLIQAFDSTNEKQLNQGREWYIKANEICKDLAQRFNTDTMTAAAVISALSPRNKWERNILDAYSVFQAVKDGKGPESVKVCTFNNNKERAFKIASGETTITKDSLKTYNFMQNIANLSDEHVTVDIWHLRACFNKSIKIFNTKVGALAYQQIKNVTVKAAQMFNLKPFELQAAIWVSIRQ